MADAIVSLTPSKARRQCEGRAGPGYAPYINLTKDPPTHHIVRRESFKPGTCHNPSSQDVVIDLVGHIPYGAAVGYTHDQMRCARCYRPLDSRCFALVCGCVSSSPDTHWCSLRVLSTYVDSSANQGVLIDAVPQKGLQRGQAEVSTSPQSYRFQPSSSSGAGDHQRGLERP